jgi:predicted Zn-dependent protease
LSAARYVAWRIRSTNPVEDINMIQVEAFQEFRTGLTYLRGGDAMKALPHLKSALEEEPSNPFYISYMGVAIAATEQKWAEAEELCRSAIRMSRRQAQLYLNLAEIYVAADRKQDAADTLIRGLRYAPHDQRLKIGLDRLAIRRPPVLPFLPRAHAVNRSLGKLRHQAMQVLASF